MLSPPSPELRTHYDRALALLQSRALPPHAASWLLRALHPPAEQLGTNAIPDMGCRPTTIASFRPLKVITRDSRMQNPDENWDLCIIVPPGDGVAAHYYQGAPGCDFSSPSQPFFTGFLPVQEAGSSALFPTIRCDSGASGMTLANVVTGLPVSKHVAFRHVCKSATVYMTASEMYDGGTVTAAQVACTPMLATGWFAKLVSQPAQLVGAMGSMFDLPLTEADIADRCPGTRTAPAKEGAYLPLRLCGPGQEFAVRRSSTGATFSGVGFSEPSDPSIVAGVDADTGVFVGCAASAPSQTATVGCVPVYTNEVAGGLGVMIPVGAYPLKVATSNPGFMDTGYDRLSTGVIIIRGLSGSASITLKCHIGLELVPDSRSPLRAMVQPAPVPSPAALDAYYEFSRALPDTLPARDNSLGLLLSKIMELVPVVFPRVQRAISALLTAPPTPSRPAAISRKQPAVGVPAPKLAKPKKKKKKGVAKSNAN